MAEHTVAAIDCGTNSTRLLISDVSGSRPVNIERLMTITRLGRGVADTGRLDEDAIARTVTVLRDFRERMDAHGVRSVRMSATSAARDAANRDAFFDAAEAATGVRPELLTGTEEAALSFAGATADLDPADGPFLIVDIGGGSTEFAVGTKEVEASYSADMGCVRFTETYLEHDPPRPEELSAAIQVARSHLDDVVRLVPGAGSATFVGLAGTITTIAAVEQGLAEYDRDRIHQFRLSHTAAEEVFRLLATESRAERIHNPGLEEARADVIVAGCCILVAVFRHFGFEECLVSESDILDGLVASQLD